MKNKDVFPFFISSLFLVQTSLPPDRYKEEMAAIMAWLQQCEDRLPSTAVAEYPVMEQRLKDIMVCFKVFFFF